VIGYDVYSVFQLEGCLAAVLYRRRLACFSYQA
jgi:hypothetical protein